MESPAVTTCNVNRVTGLSANQHVNKREMPIEFLQIDPQLNFNNRHFEDLPENFLDTISPPQGGQSLSSLNLASGQHVVSSQLASLSSMGVPGGDRGFGSGTAGLLSPLQMDAGNRDQSLGLIGMHRSNGRASEMLSGIRRNCPPYIKEEIGGGGGSELTFASASDYDGFSIQQAQRELERMANAETPPALSNPNISASMLVASLVEDATSPNQDSHFYPNLTQQPTMQMLQQQQQQHRQEHHHHHASALGGGSGGRQPQQPSMMAASGRGKHKLKMETSAGLHNNTKDHHRPSASEGSDALMAAQPPEQQMRYGVGPMGPGAGVPRAIYSTTDTTDPLNAEIDDDIYIDTKDLCKRVAYELKQHSIPQAIFAERILCRSQGTLSDLLRNPKPWNRLKSGRETFRRMFNWLQQPLHMRLSILDMYKGPMGTSAITPPTPAQNVRHHSRATAMHNSDENGLPHPKRPRLVFTDIQKRTLQAIFKETQRPSREMQQTIAEHLCLDMSTVSNFFMNARRRSRNGIANGDEPTPYQQIQQISPPPDSPPQRAYSTTVAALPSASAAGGLNGARHQRQPQLDAGGAQHHVHHHFDNNGGSLHHHHPPPTPHHHHTHDGEHLQASHHPHHHHDHQGGLDDASLFHHHTTATLHVAGPSVDEEEEDGVTTAEEDVTAATYAAHFHHRDNDDVNGTSHLSQGEETDGEGPWSGEPEEYALDGDGEGTEEEPDQADDVLTRSIAMANRTLRVKVERESLQSTPPADPIHNALSVGSPPSAEGLPHKMDVMTPSPETAIISGGGEIGADTGAGSPASHSPRIDRQTLGGIAVESPNTLQPAGTETNEPTAVDLDGPDDGRDEDGEEAEEVGET